jgi:hypothetical protein
LNGDYGLKNAHLLVLSTCYLNSAKVRQQYQEGADPLLGMLAVFNHLPAHMRVVSQLALVPVPPTWSRLYRRKSVEHPLEQNVCGRVWREAVYAQQVPVICNWCAWECWSPSS